MIKEIEIKVNPKIAYYPELLKKSIASAVDYSVTEINGYHIIKKSIDARNKNIKIIYKLRVFINNEVVAQKIDFDYKDVHAAPEIHIIGAGPAGLFAALRLIEHGLKPVILERGKEVRARKRDIALLYRKNSIPEDSNYCFGEGGAGTFSDGKLYTRSIKRGNVKRFFEILYKHGADEKILYESHPHIGSDKLPAIIENIRKTILDYGGEIYFNKKVIDFEIKNGEISSLITSDKDKISVSKVILAAGHSATELYETLYNKNLPLQIKGFAVGVRVEHPQELIDRVQYHNSSFMPYLPSASYSLSAQVEKRGVFSFCMCPGGFIVPSASHNGEGVVNGMSPSHRGSPFANSGIVVEVRPEDLKEYEKYGALAGLRFQQNLEKTAFVNGGTGLMAPAQSLTDFVYKKVSGNLPPTSYMAGLVASPVHFWLPDFISERLRQGFKLFDKRIKGFITSDALVTAVESRTSSPVRIPRRVDTFEYIGVKGIFPCGEGSGYAGGITSSAIDGQNCADSIARLFKG